jgi:hypothetical protein
VEAPVGFRVTFNATSPRMMTAVLRVRASSTAQKAVPQPGEVASTSRTAAREVATGQRQIFADGKGIRPVLRPADIFQPCHTSTQGSKDGGLIERSIVGRHGLVFRLAVPARRIRWAEAATCL